MEPAESLTIDEGGTAEYAVRLSAPPASGTATVAIASSGAAGLTVATGALLVRFDELGHGANGGR